MTITCAVIQLAKALADTSLEARINIKAHVKYLFTTAGIYEEGCADFKETGPVTFPSGGCGVLIWRLRYDGWQFAEEIRQHAEVEGHECLRVG